MTLQALNLHAEIAINNVAAFAATIKNNVRYGAKGWMQYSDVTWIATGATYYGIQLAKLALPNNPWISWTKKIDETQAAMLVALGSSIFRVFQGVFTEAKQGGKEIELRQLANADLIALTNTAALTLYGFHRFKLGTPGLKETAIAVVTYAVVKMGISQWVGNT